LIDEADVSPSPAELYDELRTVLFNDSAVAGEAAGYAMGLVMLGTASDKALDEMLQYAHETQHEKIIRGLALGLAFLMYGKEEEADSLIDTLVGDADAILRYGGMYTLALAYAGTGNNQAIRKVLHVAVSDVNDDVRRAAVTALGFLLFRNPTQVPRIVQLLSESYNPHVRYGSALALGISCAGTGLEDAIALLEPLTKDPVDFVRQGACMSLAMILIEQNETSHPKVASTRAIYKTILADKHADPMAKFGAALSQGIIDAGGRNVTISMQNKSGSGNMPAIVGMALFAQFWYWFPLAHCLSLAFTPTAIIGVNKDLNVRPRLALSCAVSSRRTVPDLPAFPPILSLDPLPLSLARSPLPQLPKFEFVSNAKPSLFAYQPATKPPTKEAVEKVKTAVLSTTAKATARAKAKEAAEEAESGGAKVDEMETVRFSSSSLPRARARAPCLTFSFVSLSLARRTTSPPRSPSRRPTTPRWTRTTARRPPLLRRRPRPRPTHQRRRAPRRARSPSPRRRPCPTSLASRRPSSRSSRSPRRRAMSPCGPSLLPPRPRPALAPARPARAPAPSRSRRSP